VLEVLSRPESEGHLQQDRIDNSKRLFHATSQRASLARKAYIIDEPGSEKMANCEASLARLLLDLP